MRRAAPVSSLAAPPRRVRIDSRARWFPDLRELMRYRQLVGLLGRRDITVRYRQTWLGTLWIFSGPLVNAGLFSLVFGRVAQLPSDGVPYFVFSYAGLLAWNVFSGTLGSASTSLTSNSGLITKIYFPRLVLPLSTMPALALNTGISFVIMVLLLLGFGIGVSIQIVVLPVFLLLAAVLAMGMGLVLTSCAVLYRDVNYLTPLLTSLLLYISPVAYSTNAVPEYLRTFYYLNPLTTIVEGCRWSILGQSASIPAWAIGWTLLLTIVAIVSGLALFARLESSFADVI